MILRGTAGMIEIRDVLDIERFSWISGESHFCYCDYCGCFMFYVTELLNAKGYVIELHREYYTEEVAHKVFHRKEITSYYFVLIYDSPREPRTLN